MTVPDHGLIESSATSAVEGYMEAFDARDVDAMLAFFADDAEMTVAPGTFRGKAGVRRVMDWDVHLSPTVKTRDTGVGLLVKGHTAVWERTIEATAEGIGYEYPIVTVFELDDDGKIRRVRAYYDKLGIMQKIASKYPGIRGRMFKTMVNYLVAQGEKGLDTSKE